MQKKVPEKKIPLSLWYCSASPHPIPASFTSVFQLLQMFFQNSWKWLFTSSCTSEKFTLLGSFRRGKSTMYLSSIVLAHIKHSSDSSLCLLQMSCHPELNQYIQDTLHCVKPLLEKNDVEKVVVVILDKEHHPVERFVFEITQPPLLSISSESLLSHVEQLLRAFILKISVCDAVLDNNPPGCTFTVLVHTREAATRNMEKIQVIKDFPWILADEQDMHMHDPRLIPLKTMTSDILKMQLYVEERAHKGT
ncbi:mitotic spindle assembly checkpoint protein MAD2B isoform X1 [Corvus cornix cornix]|uniref:mitotic spindle assembly checkpoint protein MAD2B isoform X1 n=1 Tax=Corvus cornix cornix TaxID=932674 RepID=UPI0019520F9B|nr:mitotic spindle assembly checkpoint protein MAD2B isoform X1 [Corvus cornix cornix]